MVINVTKRDIELGIVASHGACPIARAIKRKLKAPVRVHLHTAYVDMVFNWRHELPEEATNFILKYDQGRPVKPFKFVLPIGR